MDHIDTSAQHIKDFKLAIEFKYLMKHAPAGLYLLPEFDNIRVLHGVIFVRRGLYRDGIFRFRIDLPPQYNEYNTHPMITFTPPIFNPLVDPSTGRLDLSVDPQLQEWHAERHFIVTAISFLKKIFYMKNYNGFLRMPNPEAKNLFDTNKEGFLSRVEATVRESLHRVYDVQTTSNPLVFTEPKPAHAELIRDILYKQKKAASAAASAAGGAAASSSGNLDNSNNNYNENELGASFNSDVSMLSSPTHLRASNTGDNRITRTDDVLAEMEQLMQEAGADEDVSPVQRALLDMSVDSIDRPTDSKLSLADL